LRNAINEDLNGSQPDFGSFSGERIVSVVRVGTLRVVLTLIFLSSRSIKALKKAKKEIKFMYLRGDIGFCPLAKLKGKLV